MTGALRLGTRRSRLATTQSTWVADRLRARGIAVGLVEVVTEGDVSRAPLTSIGGTGVFASALRDELRAGRVDLAVHSLKDLPVAAEAGLVIAAIPERESTTDALVARDGHTLASLPAGSRVGTGAPRRAAQLLRVRPDLQVADIRGNVETRLARVREGDLDAVVLASAGLNRLGLASVVTDVLDADVMLPAAGQGALAVECRAGDAQTLAAVAGLEHPPTRAAVTAERSLLSALEAGCTAPIGALACLGADRSRLVLEAFRGDDGAGGDRDRAEGPVDDPEGLGRTLAARLLAGRPPAHDTFDEHSPQKQETRT